MSHPSNSLRFGIIGGLAWPSTITYNQTINHLYSENLGPSHCANLILVQTDFGQVVKWLISDQWQKVANALLSLARQLELGGADFIVIACNTVHKVVPSTQDQLRVPILHIVEVTSAKILELGFRKVGLLGSAPTMTDEYFISHLARYGIEVLLPVEEDRKMVHHALDTELTRGIFLRETRGRSREHPVPTTRPIAITPGKQRSALTAPRPIGLAPFDAIIGPRVPGEARNKPNMPQHARLSYTD